MLPEPFDEVEEMPVFPETVESAPSMREPRRGVGPGEVDPDAALGSGRRVLDAEHRQHGRADDRQRRHDEQYREGGDSASPGRYGPRAVHRRGLWIS